MQKSKILVGMSGGVDSSVTAYLLKSQGHDVEGLFMRNWDDDDNHCSNQTDEKDARNICQQLGIPFHTVNFSQAYMDKVFSQMLVELKRGHTPNPDILCNQEIKFKVMLDYAKHFQADYLATGHYANVTTWHGEKALATATDQTKDQTYFLCRIPRACLQRILFPIGAYCKEEIRTIAKQQKLVTAKKKDSTGICFVGERKFSDFIRQYLLDRPGDIVDQNGRIVGKHRGLFYYTLGQRKGLDIGGLQNYAEKPWFVAQKNTKTNQIMVVQGQDHPLLYHHKLRAGHLHWLVEPEKITFPLQAKARIRHRQPCQAATIWLEKDSLIAQFAEKQRAITPGQSICVYLDHVCIASAIIEGTYD